MKRNIETPFNQEFILLFIVFLQVMSCPPVQISGPKKIAANAWQLGLVNGHNLNLEALVKIHFFMK